MDEAGESPRRRKSPAECHAGDWVAVASVPDWPDGEEVHAFVLPGQVMVQPLQQLPAAVPVMSWTFRRTEMPGEGAAWVRET